MLGEFAKRLRYYRKLAGFTQAKDFAKTLGIKYTTYTSYENQNREPKYELLCRIATLLHVSIDELLGNLILEQGDGQRRPECRGLYYVPDVLRNEISEYAWENDKFDNNCYNNHLVCQTKEEAKEKLAKMLDALKEENEDDGNKESE